MTGPEHLLAITLFAKQTQFIKMLLNILKSRDIISADDIRAFDFATAGDAQSNRELMTAAVENYIKLAKALGVEVQLENS